VKCQLLVTVLFGASTLAYIKYAFSMSEESALFQLGIICNIITVAMFGSPLTTVVRHSITVTVHLCIVTW
jgi:hypothetical protein